MLEDSHLTEKLAHFGRERIPERVVHAKGTGAMDTLKLQMTFLNILEQNSFLRLGKKQMHSYGFKL